MSFLVMFYIFLAIGNCELISSLKLIEWLTIFLNIYGHSYTLK